MKIGVDGVAKIATKSYVGVNGTAREVTKIYGGVNGKAMQVWPEKTYDMSLYGAVNPVSWTVKTSGGFTGTYLVKVGNLDSYSIEFEVVKGFSKGTARVRGYMVDATYNIGQGTSQGNQSTYFSGPKDMDTLELAVDINIAATRDSAWTGAVTASEHSMGNPIWSQEFDVEGFYNVHFNRQITNNNTTISLFSLTPFALKGTLKYMGIITQIDMNAIETEGAYTLILGGEFASSYSVELIGIIEIL